MQASMQTSYAAVIVRCLEIAVRGCDETETRAVYHTSITSHAVYHTSDSFLS